jgi:hypothetical protein
MKNQHAGTRQCTEQGRFACANTGGAAVRIFVSYAHDDERLRQELANFLKLLEREGLIVNWFDGQITAGQKIDSEIRRQLKNADIMLCLVSARFLASDYIYEKELGKALARHKARQLHLIPVILRPCEWDRSPLGSLRALPKDGRPITRWPDRHEALLDVVREIRKTVESIGTRRVKGPLNRTSSRIRPDTGHNYGSQGGAK